MRKIMIFQFLFIYNDVERSFWHRIREAMPRAINSWMNNLKLYGIHTLLISL